MKPLAPGTHDCAFPGFIAQIETNIIDLISVKLPKVAKASIVLVTVAAVFTWIVAINFWGLCRT